MGSTWVFPIIGTKLSFRGTMGLLTPPPKHRLTHGRAGYSATLLPLCIRCFRGIALISCYLLDLPVAKVPFLESLGDGGLVIYSARRLAVKLIHA